MGTRGKSSIVRNYHKLFYENGYTVLSRETGLFPVIYHNDKEIFLKREGKSTFFRTAEAKIILSMFPKSDILIWENSFISKGYMTALNEYINPDVVIITTISLDHILQQGGTLEEVAEIYLNSIPKKIPVIFWTNHEIEYKSFKQVCKRMKRKADILFSLYRDREQIIFSALKKYLDIKGIKCKKEKHSKKKPGLEPEVISKIQNKTFINLGHINDALHSSLALDAILSRKKYKKVYFFFNFRTDRLERVSIFLDAFLPLFSDYVEGIIIRSDSIALSPDFLIKKIKNTYFKNKKIQMYTCDTVAGFLLDVLPKIPDKKTIVMLANTADEFGYYIISKMDLFKETYPIIKKINYRDIFGFEEKQSIRNHKVCN